MSSPSPSNQPYKSRLFNFLNRHYIKFNSQVNVKFRELAYVAKTGLQNLVLPLFLRWKNTKKNHQTFSSNTSTVSSELKDFSHQKVLVSADEVINNVNEVINLHPQLTSFPVKNFQGLASGLKDKKIICILENNQLTDIIPFNKQEEVKIIINNITDTLTNSKQLPSGEKANFLSRFLAWFNIGEMPKGEVDISQEINSINSSDLILNQRESSSVVINQKPNNIIIFIDNLISSLENLTFAKNKDIIISENNDNNIDIPSQNLDKKPQNSFSIFILIQQAIDYFFSEKKNDNSLTDNNENNILNPLSSNANSQVSLSKTDNENSTNSIQMIISQSQEKIEEIIPIIQNTTEEIITQGLNQLKIAKNNINNKLNNPDDPFQIKILILAAIDYFLNKKKSSNNLENQKNKILPNISTTQIIIIEEEVTDPWLLWEDLYGEKENVLLNTSSDNNNSIIIREDNQIIPAMEANIIELTSISNVELSNVGIIEIQEKSEIITEKNNSQSIAVNKKEEVNLDNKEIILEEIEVKVIEIKYEKHFLQFILEKLDQIILWLEEILLKIIIKIKILVK